MEKTVYNHKVDYFYSKQLIQYFGDMNIGVFDIETLGLDPLKSPLILAGLMSVNSDGSCELTQYFSKGPEDEAEILRELEAAMNKFDILLTYNGRQFDIPYVDRRAKVNGFSEFRQDFYNLDLYLVLKGHSQLKSVLPNLKQKTVEEYMGLTAGRDDEISGAESVELYKAFLSCADPAEKQQLKSQILLHNHDDILQLYGILSVILKTDVHKAMSHLGFPVQSMSSRLQLNVSKIFIDSGGLKISGTYGGDRMSYIAYDTPQNPFSCTFSTDKTFSFKLPLNRSQGGCFINLRDFLEDFNEFKKYPAYVNGFLILKENDSVNYMEMNMFAKCFLKKYGSMLYDGVYARGFL